MAETPSYLSLWEEALPEGMVSVYPTYKLKEAVGGETTYYISSEIKVSANRVSIQVAEREAEAGELLRDTSLRYIPDWTENLIYRSKIASLTSGNPKLQDVQKYFCKSSLLYFVNTFCWCLDPRRAQHPKTPFVTFPFQDDALKWVVGLIRFGRSGLEEKSREMGASWMAVVAAVWLALFYDMREALFMSMREEDVDDRTPSSLIGKARFCLNNLPEWMRAGWVEGGANDNSMKLLFPDTKSSIKGILSRGTAGRSGRATVCFNDEFAFVEDSTAVLAALSELSNSKIYLSTANGAGNEFYRMADDPATNKKTFHWTQHPLKNEESQRLKRNEPDMTEEIWASEQEIAYEVSTIGRVFSEFLSFPADDIPWIHVQEGQLVEYESAYDTYTSTDLGVSDPCSTLFMQIKTAPDEFKEFTAITYCFFAEHEARNMTAYDLRYYINQQNYRYRDHVIDMRTGVARDSGGRTWRENLADDKAKPYFSKFFRRRIEQGRPIVAVGKTNFVNSTIITFRKLLNTPGAIAISKYGCPNFIKAMQNWAFPIDKNTRLPIDKSDPNHDRWSHACKSALYLMDWLAGKGENRNTPKEHNYPAYNLSVR
ncbi:MAG TPA: hypothetical protein ENI27_04895 [bacterium]|nr:hypothetical protein [bacterium]